jgi:cellulose synthase/poly-beta-1,6-N-acetylglucosamine synthase-like glycosyltransferase
MNENVKPKVVVIMPAYNAARTLKMTYMELPHEVVDLVLLVDDGSTDQTTEVARELGLGIFLTKTVMGLTSLAIKTVMAASELKSL